MEATPNTFEVHILAMPTQYHSCETMLPNPKDGAMEEEVVLRSEKNKKKRRKKKTRKVFDVEIELGLDLMKLDDMTVGLREADYTKQVGMPTVPLAIL